MTPNPNWLNQVKSFLGYGENQAPVSMPANSASAQSPGPYMREDHRLDRYVPDLQQENFQGNLSKDLKVLSGELLFFKQNLIR